MKRFLDFSAILQNEADPAFKRRAKIILSTLLRHEVRSVLDVGCGRGFYAYAVTQVIPKAHITGIDINESYLNEAKKFAIKGQVSFMKTNVYSLPFSSNSFDAIIASEILEHLENDKLALKEIYRVLKKNGVLLITVPHRKYPFFWDPVNFLLRKFFNTHIPSTMWWLAGIWADHVRLYSEDEILYKIKQAKFKVKNLIRSTHYCFPFSHFILYGVGKNIIECGWFKSFNRFSVKKKKSFLTFLILNIIAFFDKKNDAIFFTKKDSFVNLVLTCIK